MQRRKPLRGQVKYVLWVALAGSLYVTYSMEAGGIGMVAALTAVAVFSFLATGGFSVFIAATLLLALFNSSLTSDSRLEALYLPLYVMFSAIVLLIRLLVIAPELGSRTGTGTNAGSGADGGGCGGDGGGGA